MTKHKIGFMRHKFVRWWEEEMTRNKNAISNDIDMTAEDQQRNPPSPVDVLQSLLLDLKIAQSFTGSSWKGDGSNLSLSPSSLPNVRWEDIGGLESIQKEIMDAVELPLKYPLLFKGS
jgi:SpoVK/Ycf46/Vps4 family AAA+-type ATPase